MAADMRSPNVSVTAINMEPYPPSALTNGDHRVTSLQGSGSNSVGEPPLDPSDAEVAQIDFQSTHVNMRSKKTKRGGSGAVIVAADHNSAELLPRPMSWEGELSDCERDHMCIDDDHSSQVIKNLTANNHLSIKGR